MPHLSLSEHNTLRTMKEINFPCSIHYIQYAGDVLSEWTYSEELIKLEHPFQTIKFTNEKESKINLPSEV